MKLVAVALAVVWFLPHALSKLAGIATGRRHGQSGRSIRRVRVLALVALTALMAAMLVAWPPRLLDRRPLGPFKTFGSVARTRVNSLSPGICLNRRHRTTGLAGPKRISNTSPSKPIMQPTAGMSIPRA